MTAHKTTEAEAGQAAVLAPLDLLQQLDGWMQAAGHGVDHPWCVAIAATLKHANNAKPAAPREKAAEHLFFHIANSARSLLALIDDNNEAIPHAATMHAVVAMMGWTADEGLRVHGWDSCTGDALAWFLIRAQAEEVRAAGDAA